MIWIIFIHDFRFTTLIFHYQNKSFLTDFIHVRRFVLDKSFLFTVFIMMLGLLLGYDFNLFLF